MRTLLIAAAAVLAATGPARAIETFVARLDGPTAGTPSTAVGTAVFVLTDDLIDIEYNVGHTGIQVAGSAAHVHRVVGGIAFDLGTGVNPMIGTWQFVDPQDVHRLRTGQLYINVHTPQYPAAEIRGTLMPLGNPVEDTTWGRIKALYRR
jgi:hypothetical protein